MLCRSCVRCVRSVEYSCTARQGSRSDDTAYRVQLVEYAPEKRMTAAQALAHPLISASRVGKTLLRAKTLGSAATEAAASFTEPWLSSAASGATLDVDAAA
jgi:hypothetical protein